MLTWSQQERVGVSEQKMVLQLLRCMQTNDKFSIVYPLPVLKSLLPKWALKLFLDFTKPSTGVTGSTNIIREKLLPTHAQNSNFP